MLNIYSRHRPAAIYTNIDANAKSWLNQFIETTYLMEISVQKVVDDRFGINAKASYN